MLPMTQSHIQALIDDHKRKTKVSLLLDQHLQFNRDYPAKVPYAKQLSLVARLNKKALETREL